MYSYISRTRTVYCLAGHTGRLNGKMSLQHCETSNHDNLCVSPLISCAGGISETVSCFLEMSPRSGTGPDSGVREETV